MAYDEQLTAGKLRRWETYLNRYTLPTWEQLPDLGLYMDQVIQLLSQYLDYMPPELKEEQIITAAAINNYVRTRVMPEPKKKKYYRIHLAYLIIICTLKQSLSIAMLQHLIPIGLDETQVNAVYSSFVLRHRLSSAFFVQQVKLAASNLLGHDQGPDFAVENTEQLITSAAIISGFSRLLAEKLLLLDGHTIEQENISLLSASPAEDNAPA